MKNNNKVGIVILIIGIMILAVGIGFVLANKFADFEDSITQKNNEETTTTDDNNIVENQIQTKLVNNLNNGSSKTTFNNITVDVEQSVEDMICSATKIEINGNDVSKDNASCVDSYEFYDDNVIIMSHHTSGSVFTIYNVTSNSTIITFGSGEKSLEGYFVMSYSTNNDTITLNTKACGAQCGEAGMNAKGNATFEIKYIDKKFSDPTLVN